MNMINREMRVNELIALLRQLPPDYLVACNRVYNIWVGDPDGAYYGYIDFRSKELELINQPDEDTP